MSNISYTFYVFLISLIFYILLKFIIIVKIKCFVKSNRPRLPGLMYRLVYTDQSTDKKNKNVVYSKILHCKKYDVTGKPDYIYKNRIFNEYVPVELKSGKVGAKLEPKKNDLMQLSLYFMIIEEEYNSRPKKGFLIYSDAMFKVRNTKKLRKQTLSILKDMRDMLKTGEQDVNPSVTKCRNCMCKDTVCKFYCDGENYD